MHKTIQNVGLLVIIGTLCAVFLLQFGGPQARGCASEGAVGYAAQVYDDTITTGELKAAYAMANGTRYSTQAARQMKLKERVLDGLIERTLLAREAEKLGFQVTQDDVMDNLAEQSVIYVTAPVGGPSSLPNGPQMISFADKDGVFDPENARRFIQNRLGRSVEEFALSQREETLAQRMRQVLAASVTVAPSEVWDAFVREKDQVELKYVKYDLGYYGDKLTLTPGELDAFVKAHQAEIDAEYEKEKHRYTGLEKQVRARHVLIKLAEGADDKAKADAKARAEKVRERALRGEDFATLASTLSEDPGSAKQGGDLGYNPKGRMVAPFDDAQFALKAGEISAVVETRFGFHVIKVEDVREGDVPLDVAKREIAEKQAKSAKADAQALQAATGDLAALAGGEAIDAFTTRLEARAKAAGESPLSPLVKDSRPFGRGDSPLPGVNSPELTTQAYGLTEAAPLAKAPVKIDGGYVIFRLTSHTQASKEDFEKEGKARLTESLLGRKRYEVMESHVLSLRKAAESEGAIRVNPSALEYGSSQETASL